MAAFTDEIKLLKWRSEVIFPHIDGFDPRGGLNVISSTRLDLILIFGGADRGRCHFNDVWVLEKGHESWRKVTCSGDIPTPRSGHGMACLQNFVFLHGGIDFEEEAAYNDLYMLDLDTWEWKYVGESGHEVTARNSHTFSVCKGSDGADYFVIYGGASPIEGPLEDTYYSRIPESLQLGDSGSFLTWSKLSGLTPGKREMQSTSIYADSILICGGRNEEGQILSDVWKLGPSTTNTELHQEEKSRLEGHPVVWTQLESWTLPSSRCSHGAAIATWRRPLASAAHSSPATPPAAAVATAEEGVSAVREESWLFIFGGFSGDYGIVGEPIIRQISSEGSTWIPISLSSAIPSRFGLSLCAAPSWLLNEENLELIRNSRRSKLILTTRSEGTVASKESNESGGDGVAVAVVKDEIGFVIIAGINFEQDFDDCWIISHTC